MIAVDARPGRRVFQRVMDDVVLTVIEHSASCFEVFAVGGGRCGSLGRFESRAAALRRVLAGD